MLENFSTFYDHPHFGLPILNLSLRKKYFDVMITGEKDFELRSKSKWIVSRIYDKYMHYKPIRFIKFVNGYGSERPYFIAHVLDIKQLHKEFYPVTFSNGVVVSGFSRGDYIFFLGEIVEIGNYISY